MEHHLLLLFGLHPKVVTEALYAGGVQRHIPLSRVTGIATAPAKQKAVEILLNPVTGEYYKLCREYPEHFQNLHFSPENIRTVGEHEREITDIRNSHQSQAYLDLIMATVREVTSRSDTALHGVVGGGRRTLSVYLAMVMQLLARPQDRLYQLLVDPWEAETETDFFFPTRDSYQIATRQNVTLDAKDVQVELVDIPFLRLRPRVPVELLGSLNYQEVLRWVQREVDVMPALLPLGIAADRRCLTIGAVEILLEPVELAIYWYFVEKSFARPAGVAGEDYERYFEKPKADGHFSRAASARIKRLYETLVQRDEMRGRFLKAFNKEGRLALEHLRPHFSNIKRKICEKFPDEDFNRWYVISAIGPRGDTCYGIRLDREFIRLPEARL